MKKNYITYIPIAAGAAKLLLVLEAVLSPNDLVIFIITMLAWGHGLVGSLVLIMFFGGRKKEKTNIGSPETPMFFSIFADIMMLTFLITGGYLLLASFWIIGMTSCVLLNIELKK